MHPHAHTVFYIAISITTAVLLYVVPSTVPSRMIVLLCIISAIVHHEIKRHLATRPPEDDPRC